MYMVYWSVEAEGKLVPHAREFPSAEMGGAMHFMEQLRIRRRSGEPISFVTMCSENPNSVGQPGVADAAPDYDWKKRRR